MFGWLKRFVSDIRGETNILVALIVSIVLIFVGLEIVAAIAPLLGNMTYAPEGIGATAFYETNNQTNPIPNHKPISPTEIKHQPKTQIRITKARFTRPLIQIPFTITRNITNTSHELRGIVDSVIG